MALVDDIRKACASNARIASLAPFIASAAEKHQVPELGLPAAELALDVAGIISRETGGRHILGDNGHGHYEMQLDDRSWKDWLLEHQDGADPSTNIDKGTEIYVTYFQEICAHEAQVGRSHSVEDLRRFAMAAYNCGLENKHGHGVLQSLDAGVDPDVHTTPGPPGPDGVSHPDYGKDTWRRREAFAAALGGAAVCA